MTTALVDSHCHLDRLDLDKLGLDMDGVIQAAADHGVNHLLCVAINHQNCPTVVALAEQYDNVYASIGIHPNEEEAVEPSLETLLTLADHPKVVAIGETGLDYFRLEGGPEAQQARYRRHIEVSKQTSKPLIIHSREAETDTLAILKEESADRVGGVIHCFTGDWAMAEAAMALNFYISFSGIVTFKNAAQIQEVAQKMPLDRLLIETDAPYLTPAPHRGKSNQPANVRYVADFVAQLRGISVDELGAASTDNFFRLFPCS